MGIIWPDNLTADALKNDHGLLKTENRVSDRPGTAGTSTW